MEIMRVFIKQGYRKNDLKGLKQCRMYIQALYLSNICMATGDALEKSSWNSPVKKQANTNDPQYQNQPRMNGCFGNEHSNSPYH